ncbi:MAG: inositol monophosphatase family protein [Chloroflexi bacterium]|nr:inositol monophosphatase family protein [Chloroflexota bacterium]
MLNFAIDLACRAGELTLGYQRRGFAEDEIRTKLNHVDLLTEADLASDRLITEAIRAQYPEHAIYSEESANGSLPDAEWLWIVDPVDGTTNFAHGAPLYGVNIGLAHNGVPLLGVTCDPSAGRVYWAERGRGAWMRQNGSERRLSVSQTSELRRCLLATGFPPSRLSTADNNLAEFGALELQVHGVRRLGAASIDLAWVADGILDGYWEARLKAWDWLPGYLLVTEAGGRVSDYAGNPWQLTSHTMIASNGQPAVHAALMEEIARARATVTR